MSYDDVFRRSIDDPEGFWGEAAAGIDWYTKPTRILDNDNPPFTRWFPDGTLNTSYNAIDRHVAAGRGDQTAIIYDSPVTDTVSEITYAELLDQVSHFAGALRALGVQNGDTVVIYMPMIPQALVAIYACARIGAVHSVVFGGFAAPELAVRIDDAKPKVVISASCGIERSHVIEYKPLLDYALVISEHKPEHCIVYQRPQAPADMTAGRDLDWDEAIAGAEPAGPVPVAATDPLYILYTSGTTGKPKGVVHDNGGHAVALHWSMSAIYDCHPGEVFWAASDIGWVVGHSYIVYAPLLAGATTVLYEGKPVGTPDAGAFWRVVEQHHVAKLFTAPTAIRAIKKEDPNGEERQRYDLSSLRHLFLAGERTDPDTYTWAADLLGVPVIDHWWQTETGWAITADCVGIEPLPTKPGSSTKPVPGYDLHVLRPDGSDAAAGEEGSIAIRSPLPPGTLLTLWQDDARFQSSYFSAFPGYYVTGDGGLVDEDDYVFVMGRTDDVMNVAGHRLSSGELEQVIAEHPDIAECAVIGAHDELKGQVPLAFAVLKSGVRRPASEISAEAVALVRKEIGAVASLRDVLIVDRLPKTRSGKVVRAVMRAIADGRDYTVPSTIEDPDVLQEVSAAVATFTSVHATL